MGAPSSCEERGVPNVSYNGSTLGACPNTFIISSRIDWSPYYLHMIKSAIQGTDIGYDWCGGAKEGSVVTTGINLNAAAEGTLAKLKEVAAKLNSGELKVFDVTKDNYIKVNGEKLTTYMADVDDFGDFVKDTEAIKDGYFNESGDRSAPYFDLRIDGIEYLNEKL
jgi:basic membrane protein A